MSKDNDTLTIGIRNAMDDRGITGPGYRIFVTDRKIIGNSDYAEVIVDVFEPRKRKPCMIWALRINIVRGTIHWDRSIGNNI